MLCWYDPCFVLLSAGYNVCTVACVLSSVPSVRLLVSVLSEQRKVSFCQGCSHSAQRWFYAAGCSLLQLRPVPTGPHCLCRLLYSPALCPCLPVDWEWGDESWKGGWVPLDSLSHSGFVLFICVVVCPLSSVIKLSSLHVLSWPQRQHSLLVSITPV